MYINNNIQNVSYSLNFYQMYELKQSILNYQYSICIYAFTQLGIIE